VITIKSYELITERHQPPCSGKPILHDFSEIQTEDPVSYVKTHTKNARLEIDNADGDPITIVAEEGDYRTKFVFCQI
jgi:hypothetical protein